MLVIQNIGLMLVLSKIETSVWTLVQVRLHAKRLAVSDGSGDGINALLECSLGHSSLGVNEHDKHPQSFISTLAVQLTKSACMVNSFTKFASDTPLLTLPQLRKFELWVSHPGRTYTEWCIPDLDSPLLAESLHACIGINQHGCVHHS